MRLSNLALSAFAVLMTVSAPATAAVSVENHMAVDLNVASDGIALYEYGSGTDATADFSAGTHDGTLNNGGALEIVPSTTDWWDLDWSRQQCFTVNASDAVAEYPLRLLVDTSASVSGVDDIRVVEGAAGALLDIYVEGPVPSASTVVYAKAEPLPAGASTYCVYFDNTVSAAPSASDEFAPFTYTSGQSVRYYTMLDTYSGNGADSRTDVVSYIDGNTVVEGATVANLNTGGFNTFSGLDEHSVISATGPIAASVDRNAKETLIPESFADNQFTFPNNRGTERFWVRSPFASTTLRFYNNGVEVSTLAITPADGSVGVTVPAAAPGYISIVADGGVDFLAAHVATALIDTIVGVPWYGDDLYGVGSTQMHMGTTSAVSVDWWRDNGTSGTAALTTAALTSFTAGLGGSGNGAAFRLSGPSYFAAIQQADGSGGEATSFFPERLLAATYRIPIRTGYLTFACPVPGTQITIDGGAASTCAGTGVGHFWTGANRNAGTLIEADNPIFVYAQSRTQRDEHNVLNAKVHTPYISSLTITPGPVETLSEICGSWISPSFSTAGVFGTIDVAATVPPDTTTTVQISTDGGNTFVGPDGTDTTFFADGDLVPYTYDFGTSAVIMQIELCTTDSAATPSVTAASIEHSLDPLGPGLSTPAPVAIPSSPTTETTPVLRVYAPATGTWTSWLDLTSGSNLTQGNYTVSTDHAANQLQIQSIGGVVAEPSPPQAHDFVTPYSVLVDHSTASGQNTSLGFDVVDEGSVLVTSAVRLDFTA